MGIKEGYKLIPMSEITDEAREIAVEWGANMKDDFITQKQKLASDIMNYARKNTQSKLNPVIEKWEGELKIWSKVINENALFHTKEEKLKAANYIGVIQSVLTDLKKIKP